MTWLRVYWETPFHPARAFWLVRGVYLLLALDVLLLMVEHAGRYGAGGFNVAHFAVLDRLLGVPSPGRYLALLTLAALLALCAAFGHLAASGRVVLQLAYTLAWAWSQHDSYQHHYFLSWILAWLVFMPTPRAADCLETRSRTSSPGFALVATSCAIVYSFTALSKSTGAWQSGAVLRHLGRAPGPFAWLVEVGQPLLGELALRAAALGVLLLQVLIASAYWLAPLRDTAGERSARWLGGVCTIGWCGALAFHLLTELDAGFSIGWFSYYMLWLSTVVFAPAPWLVACTRLFAPLDRVARLLALRRASVCYAGLLSAALALAWLVHAVDLPGVAGAAAVVALAYFGVALWRLARSEVAVANAQALTLGLSLTCLALLLGLTDVRFDYYRRAAGELKRMGRTAASLALYRKAERYAPPGASRQEVIEQLERQLSEQRGQ